MNLVCWIVTLISECDPVSGFTNGSGVWVYDIREYLKRTYNESIQFDR